MKPEKELTPIEYNLNDPDVQNKLTAKGLNIKGKMPAKIQISENESTGYVWIRDERECAGIMEITDEFEPYPECCGYPGTKTFTLKPLAGGGKCTFRIISAKSWEFSQEDFATYNGGNIMIEIPVKIRSKKP